MSVIDSIPSRDPSPSRISSSNLSEVSETLYYSVSSKTTIINIDKNEILENAYIYIIYPSNYNESNIDTRLFYIGTAINNFNKKKEAHYEELYNNSNSSKKYKIMRQYIYNCYDCFDETALEKEKLKEEDRRIWQIKVIFHGINSCTASYLEALEGLYIHYYYSIMNDRELTSFKFNDITDYQINYFNYINLNKHLSKNANFSYDKKHSYYNIRPYNFINKNNISLSLNRHIYKELCEQSFIPKFNSIEELTKVLIITNTKEEFNNNFINKSLEVKEVVKEPSIYITKIKDKYKCNHCVKRYKFINSKIITHYKEKHNITITIEDLL